MCHTVICQSLLYMLATMSVSVIILTFCNIWQILQGPILCRSGNKWVSRCVTYTCRSWERNVMRTKENVLIISISFFTIPQKTEDLNYKLLTFSLNTFKRVGVYADILCNVSKCLNVKQCFRYILKVTETWNHALIA